MEELIVKGAHSHARQQLIERGRMIRVAAKKDVLFVCSENQWRSPTAEAVWRKHPLLSVRSGGTSSSARHTVSIDDIRWADVILVMEEKHKSRLLAAFGPALGRTPLHVLDIPDSYRYMDPDLVAELETSVAALLDLD